MRMSLSRLPRLLGVLVIAFAQYEDRPLLGAVELLRGLSMQVAYRWATGRIMAAADDRAVLSVVGAFRSKERHTLVLEAFGASVGHPGGVGPCGGHECDPLLPLWLVVVFTGEHSALIAGIGADHHRRTLVDDDMARHLCLPGRVGLDGTPTRSNGPSMANRLLGAVPARRGHGGQLLSAFLAEADDSMTEVVLHCEKRNVAFYRHFGFREADVARPGAQRVMLRRLTELPSPVGASRFKMDGGARSTRRQPVAK